MRKNTVLLFIFIFSLPLFLFSQDLYWEEPGLAVQSGAGFSQVVSSSENIHYFWQESVEGAEKQEIFLSHISSTDGLNWEAKRQILGPFSFTGSEIQFYSVLVDNDDNILLAVSEPDNGIHIYKSDDGGKSFLQISETEKLPTRIMPRLSLTYNGGYILFATLASQADNTNTLGIGFTRSDDGSIWSTFKPLTPEEIFRGTFLPSHVSLQAREYVVFQSFTLGVVSSFQLYSKYSDDGGVSWSEPFLLTDFWDPADGFGENPFQYDNQRPNLAVLDGELYLSWERAPAGQPPQIFIQQLDRQGRGMERAEQVSRGNRSCEKPQSFLYRDELYMLWFDNRAGDYHIILAKKDGIFWEDSDITILMRGNSTFPAAVDFNNDLYLFWENEKQERASLIALAPDKTVDAPILRGSNFSEGRPAKQDEFIIRWNSPVDSSGIAGYSYLSSRSETAELSKRLMTLDRNRVVELEVLEDGLWYFHLSAQDYAGNWSDIITIEFNRDTTPPEPVLFQLPETDVTEMLLSNSQTLSWTPPEDDPYITGYTWRLQYLAGSASQIEVDPDTLSQPPTRQLGAESEFSFYNRDNGYYALTVRAIDIAGNYGKPESLFFRMNKYIPVTYVSRISADIDELGAYALSITGRGFSAGGEIQRVILDIDREPPYDLEITISDNLYKVETDRYISGPVLDEIYTGDYWIGVEHPVRGLHFSRSPVTLTSLGTVKFGDFDVGQVGGWKSARPSRWNLSFNMIFVGALIVFLGVMLLLTTRRLVTVVQEGRQLSREVQLLLRGPGEIDGKTEKRIMGMKKKGRGLRFKFALYVTMLVLIIVAMVAVPLAVITSSQQEAILAKGLEQRAEVLLESLASGARAYLPTKNILELSGLPSQMGAMGEDALFVTITSQGLPESEDFDSESFDYVWATNEESLIAEDLPAGRQKNNDPVSGFLQELAVQINQEASSRVSEISAEIIRLNEQTEPLVAEFIRTGDPETEEAINSIQEQLKDLDSTLSQRLYEIGNQVFSLPEFDSEISNSDETTYIFFKPVLFRSSDDDIFFRGIVRLGVSNRGILNDIDDSREQLTLIIGTVAVIAIVLGIIGALLLAAVIIRPINILVKGVEEIRDAGKKQELEGKPINTKTHDELSQLAETINQMTHGLIEAEKASEMLVMGKDVQKQYIPLDELSGTSVKMSTVNKENDNIAIFGYYEGALGVSGDLFDYKEIDEEHIAFIKGDVSGKGVPAALIMVQVATLFTYFFRNWKIRNDERLMQGKKGLVKPDIAYLVDQTNDLLDFIGAAKAGRFAAFIVGVLNVKTGRCELCHAGDNMVHIYDHEKGMYTRTLAERPAAGSFPSDLVKMQMGFSKDVQVLKKNDAMILYTDGIEEAQRHFRDPDFTIRNCGEAAPEELEGEEKDNWRHGDERNGFHPPKENFEELGNTRIHEIVNTIFNKGIYTLYKFHNPLGDEILTFNFSTCEGTIEEAVIALMSVERVFRIYPQPSSGIQDEVRIDQRIAGFLETHFEQYNSYFSHPVINKKGVSSEDIQLYRYFSHLKEDHQFDDLTVLGILKK